MIRKTELQRSLSIQSCFPELFSTPNSTGDESSLAFVINVTEVKVGIDTTNTFVFPQKQLPTLASGHKPLRNLTMYVPLYRAALKGDWERAKEFLALHPGALTAQITKGHETALHIAAGANQIKFVEELVKMMDTNDLALKNKHDNTALCFAAASGITRIARVMVEKNKYLPAVRGSQGVTPLHMAALLSHREMVWFLLSVTNPEHLTQKDFTSLLIATISSDLYDIARHILVMQPELSIQRDVNGETPLHVLARKPSVFYGEGGLGIWERCIYPWVPMQVPCAYGCTYIKSTHHSHIIAKASLFLTRPLGYTMQITGIKKLQERKFTRWEALNLVDRVWSQVLLLDDAQIGDLLRSPSRPLFVAAKLGNFDFIVQLLRSYPDLIWKVDDKSRSIFHIAVKHRHEKIFKLIYDIGAHKDLITSYKDVKNRNILHLAGKLAPFNRLNIVSGAALQMQRELIWFKEVEKNVPPLYKEMKDVTGRTPQMLFTEEHKGLVKGGEKWMKDTATSCMLVATLITTVMFAAIFTVPGGNDNTKGTPVFLKDKPFIIFAISDALALFSSVTSILMFLSILTSRYAEEDFLESLPKRLVVGLTTLFFSIASMLLAFSSSFYIVLGEQLEWILIPVAITTCIPVMSFAFLQFPLLADMVHSTYGSGFFSRKHNEFLY